MRTLYGGSSLEDHAGGIERSEHTGTSLWAQATRENFTFEAVGILGKKIGDCVFAEGLPGDTVLARNLYTALLYHEVHCH